jgi:phosphate transporter
VATFVSHTVAALILMPIISTIGEHYNIYFMKILRSNYFLFSVVTGISLEIPEIVVIGAAFSISAAMALPFSSFPNVNSLLIVDDFQRAYLGVKEFAVTGFPISMITVFLIATVGFLLIDVIVVSHN